MRPRSGVLLVLAAAILLIAIWLVRPRAAPPTHRPAQAPVAAASPSGPQPADSSADAGSRLRRVVPSQVQAKRDALRSLILRAQEPTEATRPRPPAAAPAAEDRDRPGTLVDRTGGRAEMLRYLNQDFMPLARECIELAHEEAPGLAGMLALSVETLAGEELGAVVEKAEAAPRNQVWHPGLLECIRETALSVTFPPPLVSGREGFELTLRIEPARDAAAAR